MFYFKIAITTITVISTFLPCIVSKSNQNFFLDDFSNKNVQQKTLIKKEIGRVVQKFKSTKFNSTTNLFLRMQNRMASTNENIKISNESLSLGSFSFSVKYAHFNSYGLKNSNFEITSKANSNFSIQVGTELFAGIEVRMNALNNKKWANLDLKKLPPLNPKKVDMSSISFEIIAKGDLVNPTIVLNRCYLTRTNPGEKHIEQYGVFNVANFNNKIHKFALSEGAKIAIGVVFAVLGTIAMTCSAVGGVWYLRRRLKEIYFKTADEDIPWLFKRMLQSQGKPGVEIRGAIEDATVDQIDGGVGHVSVTQGQSLSKSILNKQKFDDLQSAVGDLNGENKKLRQELETEVKTKKFFKQHSAKKVADSRGIASRQAADLESELEQGAKDRSEQIRKGLNELNADLRKERKKVGEEIENLQKEIVRARD